MKRNIGLGILGGLGAVAYYIWENHRYGVRKMPEVIIDESVFQRKIKPPTPPPLLPPPEMTTSAKPTVVEMPRPVFPYQVPGFGLDSARNRDDISLETYMHPPLESTGRTYTNAHSFEEVAELEEGEIPEAKARDSMLVKYIRIQVQDVRSEDSDTVAIGGIRVLYGNKPIKDQGLQLWNPHTGEKQPYTGGLWRDSDQWMIVLCFSDLVEVNRYEFKTSVGEEGEDPLCWTIEGSTNGTFWTMMDDRSNNDLPMPSVRGFTVGYWMRALQEVKDAAAGFNTPLMPTNPLLS